MNIYMSADFWESLTEPVKFILEKFALPGLNRFSGFIAAILYAVLAFGAKRAIIWFKKISRKKKDIKSSLDLHPIYDRADIEEYTTNYIQVRFQLLSPNHDVVVKPDAPVGGSEKKLLPTDKVVAVDIPPRLLIAFFIRSVFVKKREINPKLKGWLPISRSNLKILSDRQFFFILADTGMGKTAFTLNLFLAYAKKMRRDFDIEILRLTITDVESEISAIKDKKHTILLLDALDEDKKAGPNVHKRIAELVNLTKEFRKVIFTCRTQFFTDERLEPLEIELKKHGTEIGIQQFSKLYLSPFSYKDIILFIHGKYTSAVTRQLAIRIAFSIPDIAIRPMVLKHIDDFLVGKRFVHYKIDIYELIVEKWIEREKYNVPPDKRQDFPKNILTFSRDVAKYIYEHPVGNELIVLSERIDLFANEHNIPLDALELKSRSLLNRGEQNKYKFAHKSILEYFLAANLYKDYNFLLSFNIKGFDAAFQNFQEMCTKHHTIPFIHSLCKFDLQNLSPDLKLELTDILHRELGISLTKLDVIIWREHSRMDYRLDWTLLEEIRSVHIKGSAMLENLKVFLGLTGLDSITIYGCQIKDLSWLKFTKISTVYFVSCENTHAYGNGKPLFNRLNTSVRFETISPQL